MTREMTTFQLYAPGASEPKDILTHAVDAERRKANLIEHGWTESPQPVPVGQDEPEVIPPPERKPEALGDPDE